MQFEELRISATRYNSAQRSIVATVEASLLSTYEIRAQDGLDPQSHVQRQLSRADPRDVSSISTRKLHSL